ncbi:helix-turn-helix family protein : Uncharacterized protein OS=Acinetobacter baumannii OIFC110 GN=ACIN5110_2336 PE=4 SV=1 [Gemmata massiliana]|uniref:Helix-turn-helix family protein: Uncharacterized protein n=1 Tax=Gemmata massiliana TaxID=1210884 RepID=A0A6P2DER5_9BACT|nr:hypothetical protein [Gemmata massiliana]VTS00438.1 helix-turn-helix family protein : Uncharacterized protein OS=Acinetobacter baumannii OIFC110 GN=ACIN5110_2336 PE=4 SV=1 [Gemmata massiliana]
MSDRTDTPYGGMTPVELRTFGERLYGTEWQTPLARALPVSTRAIRYWLSGERKIREVIARRIQSLRAEPHGDRRIEKNEAPTTPR